MTTVILWCDFPFAVKTSSNFKVKLRHESVPKAMQVSATASLLCFGWRHILRHRLWQWRWIDVGVDVRHPMLLRPGV